MSDPLRLAELHGWVHEICEAGIEGDIVECGVWNGGSAAVMAAAIANYPGRQIWLYDTFEGIPAPGPQDEAFAQAFAGEFVASGDSVLEVLRKVKFPLDRVVLRRGTFRDAFREPPPSKVALLHIDADWYESVLSALQTFYVAVADGGLIVLDDFGHWEGARKAFYTFCRSQGIQPLLERVGYTQAFWFKGREHNRDAQEHFYFGTYRARWQSRPRHV